MTFNSQFPSTLPDITARRAAFGETKAKGRLEALRYRDG
jgi:hypothetical protein